MNDSSHSKDMKQPSFTERAEPPPTKDDQLLGPVAVRLLSSSVGSIVTAFAVTPLDVVKVRLQALQSTPNAKTTLGECSRCGLFVLNTGLIHGEVMLDKLKSPHFRCLVGDRVGGAFAAAAATVGTTAKATTATAGSSAAICGCPASAVPRAAFSSAGVAAMPAAVPSSTIQALAHIFRTEGIAGIYSGLFPTLLMAVPATVLYFNAYDDLKERLSPVVGADIAPPLAGMTARMLASAVTSPFELVRTIMQTGEATAIAASQNRMPFSPLPTTTLGSFRALLKSGGVPALWRGLGPTLWRDVPFSAVYWFAFESGKRQLELGDVFERRPHEDQSHDIAAASRAFVAGAAAGTLAAALTTPMDVVKTRRQLFSAVGSDAVNSNSGVGGASSGNGSTPTVMRAIWREEGLRGLMSGLRPRILKIAPACAIMISSYEAGKRAFGVYD